MATKPTILWSKGVRETRHGSSCRNQLLIDISELVQRDVKSGVQRVVRGILLELLSDPPINYRVEAVFATTSEVGYRYARKFVSTALLDRSVEELNDAPIQTRPGDIFLGLDLQPHVVPYQAEYLKRLQRVGVKVYFVVHDLIPVLWPNTFPVGASELHAKWLRTVVQFDGALCVSRSVAGDLKKWLKLNAPERFSSFKIGWFHLGADIEHSAPTRGIPENAPQLLNKLAGKLNFLIVGTIEPRKCHAQVLAAFDLLWGNNVDISLVIVGKQGWMVEQLVERLNQHPQLGEHLFWLNGISDEYLDKIYSASSCLIAASIAEGFGLPLIEAAKRRIPIIARDIEVFREVADGHAFFFIGDEPANLASAIQKWIGLYKVGLHPQTSGMPFLDWMQSKNQLLGTLLTMLMPTPTNWASKMGGLASAIEQCILHFLHSQLQLLRRRRTHLRFGINGSGVNYLGRGWSQPENWGVWSDGPLSEISLEDDGFAKASLSLLVKAGAFIPFGKGEQVIGISANGIPVTSWIFRSDGSKHRWLKANIPAALMNDRKLLLTFHTSTPSSPAASGNSPDNRMLGISVSELLLISTRRKRNYIPITLGGDKLKNNQDAIEQPQKTFDHLTKDPKVEREMLRIESLKRIFNDDTELINFEINSQSKISENDLKNLRTEYECARLRLLRTSIND